MLIKLLPGKGYDPGCEQAGHILQGRQQYTGAQLHKTVADLPMLSAGNKCRMMETDRRDMPQTSQGGFLEEVALKLT